MYRDVKGGTVFYRLDPDRNPVTIFTCANGVGLLPGEQAGASVCIQLAAQFGAAINDVTLLTDTSLVVDPSHDMCLVIWCDCECPICYNSYVFHWSDSGLPLTTCKGCGFSDMRCDYCAGLMRIRDDGSLQCVSCERHVWCVYRNGKFSYIDIDSFVPR